MKAKQVKASRRSARKQAGPIRPAAKMPMVNPHAAGIDVGSTEHWVCVPEDSVPACEANVRAFGGFSADLDELVEWLLACGIKTVAIESTGVYWIPLVQKLEAVGLEAVLVNARHLKHVPGRKTDVKDCQWLQQLHSYGLLNGSFRPTQDICCVRSLLRHRGNLVASCGREVQHMQKALQQMNIHLHHAVSDLVGATGLRILDAILAGERDPKALVELRDDKLCKKTTKEEMEKALEGEPTRSKRKKKRFHPNKARHGLKRDLTQELQRICGVDLTQILGLNVLGVLIIISEIGVDMSRWRSAKAFCSWLGLCPGNKISGGKVLDSRTAHVANRVAILLRNLAPNIGKTDTWLGIFHRRMRARLVRACGREHGDGAQDRVFDLSSA